LTLGYSKVDTSFDCCRNSFVFITLLLKGVKDKQPCILQKGGETHCNRLVFEFIKKQREKKGNRFKPDQSGPPILITLQSLESLVSISSISMAPRSTTCWIWILVSFIFLCECIRIFNIILIWFNKLLYFKQFKIFWVLGWLDNLVCLAHTWNVNLIIFSLILVLFETTCKNTVLNKQDWLIC